MCLFGGQPSGDSESRHSWQGLGGIDGDRLRWATAERVCSRKPTSQMYSWLTDQHIASGGLGRLAWGVLTMVVLVGEIIHLWYGYVCLSTY